jgi:hypothetical protein
VATGKSSYQLLRFLKKATNNIAKSTTDAEAPTSIVESKMARETSPHHNLIVLDCFF